jgi:uncharacterized protein YndB with AHSA1/START domain
MSKLNVTMPSDTEIRMERTFDAPRRLVIQAMSDPALIARWLGGKRGSVKIPTFEYRVGGSYRYEFRTHDGHEFSFSGTFETISDDTVVHTEAFNDMPGPAIVTTTYREEGGVTTMTVTVKFPSKEVRDMVAATGMAEGAAETYDLLAELVRTMK